MGLDDLNKLYIHKDPLSYENANISAIIDDLTSGLKSKKMWNLVLKLFSSNTLF